MAPRTTILPLVAHHNGRWLLLSAFSSPAPSFLLCAQQIYRTNAIELRRRFDQNKNERNYVKAKNFLEAGVEEFHREKHPDPYKPCTALDGTKWERNVHPPAETCQMTPEEEGWYNDKNNCELQPPCDQPHHQGNGREEEGGKAGSDRPPHPCLS